MRQGVVHRAPAASLPSSSPGRLWAAGKRSLYNVSCVRLLEPPGRPNAGHQSRRAQRHERPAAALPALLCISQQPGYLGTL